jgi:hypothetical protein
MAYHQVTSASLTPSRPAPQAPRRGTEHTGTEYSTNSSSSGVYNTSLSSFTPSSPSASPYAFPYSGIGGSPNRGADDALNSQIVRSGLVSMKEDSFANWLFQRKWLVLREQTLSIHKNEVRLLTYLNVLPLLTVLQTAPQQSVIMLNGISNIERIDMKPYCLLLETTDRRFYLSLKNDEELYGWLDDVYSRSPLMGVSNPTNFVHKVHVGFDPVSGAFTVCSSRFTFHRVPLSLSIRECRSNGANC